MKFDRHIGTAAEVPVKFQSDRTILNTNLTASRLYEILRKDVFSDIETGPCALSQRVDLFSPYLFRSQEKDQENAFKVSSVTWWCIQMETFSALLAIVRGVHQSPVNSFQKGQWRGALMFSLICAWTHDWASQRDADDLRRHRAHYDVNVMIAGDFDKTSLSRLVMHVYVDSGNILTHGFTCTDAHVVCVFVLLRSFTFKK